MLKYIENSAKILGYQFLRLENSIPLDDLFGGIPEIDYLRKKEKSEKEKTLCGKIADCFQEMGLEDLSSEYRRKS